MVGSRSRRRVPDRLDRRSTTAPTTASASGSNGFTLKVLDASATRSSSRRRSSRPRRARRAFAVGSESPERVIRRAAMIALTSVRGQEGRRFKALAHVRQGRRRPPRRHPGAAAHPRHVLAEGGSQAAARQPAGLHPQGPGRRAHLAGGARRPATRRRPGRAVAARPRPSRSARSWASWACACIRIGTVPDQMLFDKERIVVQGRQAGRDRLREHRPDAAQLRRHAARLAGGNRHARRRRRPRSPAPLERQLRAARRTRSCSRAGCSSRASRRS